MKNCCKAHVTSTTVMSPTLCATCGTHLVVRGSKWQEYQVPGPMDIRVDNIKIDVIQTMFPDGQAHVSLSYEPKPTDLVRITTSLQHPADFFYLLLVKEVLDNLGCEVDLFITYMSGARMDRRIDSRQPFTLKVFAKMVKDAGFRRIKVMDPHSEVALALLDADAAYPIGVLSNLLSMPRFNDEACPTVIIAPDAGATKRVDNMLTGVSGRLYFKGLMRTDFTVVQGLKHRDMATGKLSGFSVADEDGQAVAGKRCLILDDICDGGGTFVGLADLLTQHGAEAVDLFVTHGIFSKGRRLEGIDGIFTTDTLGHGSAPGFMVYGLREYGDLTWY